MKKSYRDLCRLSTFEERFNYLHLGGRVGYETFGPYRYLNQILYRSTEWKRTRRGIIIRDNGCDLGVPGMEIPDRIIVHHINPLDIEDIELGRDCLFDPDNLISCSEQTSNALHYGDKSFLLTFPQERKKGDTLLW